MPGHSLQGLGIDGATFGKVVRNRWLYWDGHACVQESSELISSLFAHVIFIVNVWSTAEKAKVATSGMGHRFRGHRLRARHVPRA